MRAYIFFLFLIKKVLKTSRSWLTLMIEREALFRGKVMKSLLTISKLIDATAVHGNKSKSYFLSLSLFFASFSFRVCLREKKFVVIVVCSCYKYIACKMVIR
jgi:hypothetical protein